MNSDLFADAVHDGTVKHAKNSCITIFCISRALLRVSTDSLKSYQIVNNTRIDLVSVS